MREWLKRALSKSVRVARLSEVRILLPPYRTFAFSQRTHSLPGQKQRSGLSDAERENHQKAEECIEIAERKKTNPQGQIKSLKEKIAHKLNKHKQWNSA